MNPSMARRAAHAAEIRRDAEVVKAALCEELQQIFMAAHLSPELGVEELRMNVVDAVAMNRRAGMHLASQRGTLRGNRFGSVEYDDSAPLPEALQVFRHRGNYHGAYSSLSEIGDVLRPAMGIELGLAPGARTNVARALHLRGELWTYVQDKVVHVFARPGRTVDTLLANAQPHSAKLAPAPFRGRPQLRLVPSPNEITAPPNGKAPRRRTVRAP